jgi:hypothetical protein
MLTTVATWLFFRMHVLPDSHAIYVRAFCLLSNLTPKSKTNKEKAKQRPSYASTAGSFWLAAGLPRSVIIALVVGWWHGSVRPIPTPGRPHTHNHTI